MFIILVEMQSYSFYTAKDLEYIDTIRTLPLSLHLKASHK